MPQLHHLPRSPPPTPPPPPPPPPPVPEFQEMVWIWDEDKRLCEFIRDFGLVLLQDVRAMVNVGLKSDANIQMRLAKIAEFVQSDDPHATTDLLFRPNVK
jgi:hypothetical protein